jgi:nitrite reductase/ring-hydroxylating ferredoxin subunit
VVRRFVPVARLGELREGARLVRRVEGVEVLIIQDLGRTWVIDARCPHAGAPLARGHLDEHLLWCPKHGFSWDLRTGDRVSPPVTGGGCERLRCFDAEIRDGRLGVLLPA